MGGCERETSVIMETPRVSELSGLWDICQGELQAWGEVSQRESVCAEGGSSVAGVKIAKPFGAQLIIL